LVRGRRGPREDRTTSLRRSDLVPSIRSLDPVPEVFQQLDQLVGAAVDVADDVERSGLSPAVGPQRPPREDRRLHLLGRGEDGDVPEALPLQASERPVEAADLVSDDVRAEVPVGAGTVALPAHGFGQVEDYGDGQDVVLAGEGDERFSRLLLHVRRVHDHEPAGGQALGGYKVQDLEGIFCCGLVVLVVGNQAAAEVRGEDLRGLEVTLREARLARARGPDKSDEAEVRYGDLLRQARIPPSASAAPRPGPRDPRART
jgi:hypothetical protein